MGHYCSSCRPSDKNSHFYIHYSVLENKLVRFKRTERRNLCTNEGKSDETGTKLKK